MDIVSLGWREEDLLMILGDFVNIYLYDIWKNCI